MSLLPCPACRRHVVGAATVCPFCDEPLGGVDGERRAAPRMSRIALLAFGATAVACSSSTVVDERDPTGATSSTSTTGASTSTSSGGTSSVTSTSSGGVGGAIVPPYGAPASGAGGAPTTGAGGFGGDASGSGGEGGVAPVYGAAPGLGGDDAK